MKRYTFSPKNAIGDNRTTDGEIDSSGNLVPSGMFVVLTKEKYRWAEVTEEKEKLLKKVHSHVRQIIKIEREIYNA